MRLPLYGRHIRMNKPNKRIDPMTNSAVSRGHSATAADALLVTAHPPRSAAQPQEAARDGKTLNAGYNLNATE